MSSLLPGFIAALMRAWSSSRPAFAFTCSNALPCCCASKIARASATSRSSGRVASLKAGLFMMPGRPIAAPQRLGTTAQSSCRFGRIASWRPMFGPGLTPPGAGSRDTAGARLLSLGA